MLQKKINYFCSHFLFKNKYTAMNISKEQIDDLNAVVRIEITKNDYETRVDDILKDYRKKANIPGFRKGRVPMGMIKKQYGQGVMVEEINKIIQENLNNFLAEEKIEILGNPLPKEKEDFSWDAEDFIFEFELGLTPEFEVKLPEENQINSYDIVVGENVVGDQIKSMRRHYGQLRPIEVVEDDSVIAGTFQNEEKELEKETSLNWDQLNEGAQKQFTGAKVGDVLSFNVQDIFENNQNIVAYLGVKPEEKESADFELNFTIKEINEQLYANLDQELFEKLYPAGEVNSEKELEERIEADAKKELQSYSEQNLINAIIDNVLENTEIELPKDFLTRWIKATAKEPLTDEQAIEEFDKNEKAMRYQLIEGKLLRDNNIEVAYDDVKEETKKLISLQMAQYGQPTPEDAEMDQIVAKVLGNQEEGQRIFNKVKERKLLDFFKNNVTFNQKEVSFEDFVKEAYDKK